MEVGTPIERRHALFCHFIPICENAEIHIYLSHLANEFSHRLLESESELSLYSGHNVNSFYSSLLYPRANSYSACRQIIIYFSHLYLIIVILINTVLTNDCEVISNLAHLPISQGRYTKILLQKKAIKALTLFIADLTIFMKMKTFILIIKKMLFPVIRFLVFGRNQFLNIFFVFYDIVIYALYKFFEITWQFDLDNRLVNIFARLAMSIFTNFVHFKSCFLQPQLCFV